MTFKNNSNHSKLATLSIRSKTCSCTKCGCSSEATCQKCDMCAKCCTCGS